MDENPKNSRFVNFAKRDFMDAKSEATMKYHKELRQLELALLGSDGILKRFPDCDMAFNYALAVIQELDKDGIVFGRMSSCWPST